MDGHKPFDDSSHPLASRASIVRLLYPVEEIFCFSIILN